MGSVFFETNDPVRAHENSPVQDATAAEVMPSTVEEMPWRIPPVGTPISSRDAGEFYQTYMGILVFLIVATRP